MDQHTHGKSLVHLHTLAWKQLDTLGDPSFFRWLLLGSSVPNIILISISCNVYLMTYAIPPTVSKDFAQVTIAKTRKKQE